MTNLLQLRTTAREIFRAAMSAVEPVAAIRENVRFEGSRLTVCNSQFELSRFTNVFGIAIGKASERMAYSVEEVFGDHYVDGVLSGPRSSPHWASFPSGHPLPNQASLAAAKAAIHLLETADHENSLIVFLISGGGSAMFEWPINEDITLADLQMANEILVGCGASISEVNAVRRAFSAVKGGRLAAYAPKSRQLTLIVSDVPKGEEHNVASGPTWTPPADAPSAAEVVARYKLGDRLPESVMRAIRQPVHSKHRKDDHRHFVLIDNDSALQAAAKATRARGFITEIAGDIIDDPIEPGCEQLLARLSELQAHNPSANVCLVSGGEFACPVRGEGIGGRNLETALRLAIAADRDRDRIGQFVALLAGTDGIDGNSPAAGAIIDSTTLERSRTIGLDANNFLDRSDSYSFLAALDDVITTGPTGTNVRDLRILMSAPYQ